MSFLSGVKEYIHKGFKNPSKFNGTGDEILAGVRRVRDEIKSWIQKTFGK